MEEMKHTEDSQQFSEQIDQILREKKTQLTAKRIFDIFASISGLVVLAIPLTMISLIIKLTSPGPVFFRQVRMGKNFREFSIYKFRTMIPEAEKKGMQITVGADDRITKIGHFLRKMKLDEFPQLINVLMGHMSLVGPRPEVRKYVELYDDYQKNVLKIRPGITDPASITYRNESDILAKSEDPEKTYVEDIMPAKLSLNLEYLKQMSLGYDLRLIFKTFLRILE